MLKHNILFLSLPSKKNRKTGNSLSSVGLSTEDMLNVINNLDFDRTHAHDEISIGCLKYVFLPSSNH